MIYDIIIENGMVLDPKENTLKQDTIYIIDDKIVNVKDGDDIKYKQKVDAKGCYVMPGLIENHTHIYTGGGDTNLNPDVIMLPSGVTSAIDQGSSGWSNFDLFRKSVIYNSLMNIKCYLNVSNTGLVTEDYFENINPVYFNKDKIKFYCNKYKDIIIGLKIRLCKKSLFDMGIKPLEKAIEIADELNLPMSVHIKDLDILDKCASLLRKDDVWVHMYQLEGDTILNEDGKIKDEVLKARERGVKFDVASGRSGFSFDMIKKAFKCDFMPDLIGTDLVTYNVYERPLFSLVYAMSIYLNLGFSMEKLAKLCIKNPAKAMHMSGEIDTLKPDTTADICILKVKEKETVFEDRHGGKLAGNRLIVPQMTIKSGKVMYRSIEF